MVKRNQKKHQRLLRRRPAETSAAAHVLPEVPAIDAGTFDTHSTESLPAVPSLDGGTFGDNAAELHAATAPEPLGRIALLRRRFVRGSRTPAESSPPRFKFQVG